MMARGANRSTGPPSMMRTSLKNMISLICFRWPTGAKIPMGRSSLLPLLWRIGWMASMQSSGKSSKGKRLSSKLNKWGQSREFHRNKQGSEPVDFVEAIINFISYQTLIYKPECKIVQNIKSSMAISKLPILLILAVVVPATVAFQMEDDKALYANLPAYSGNYSRNMSQTELNYIIALIGAAERKAGENQLGLMAELLSKDLQANFSSPWSVMVFGPGVQQIGVGVQSRSDKAVAFIRTGIYQLSYVMYQKTPISCSHYDTSMTKTEMYKKEYYSSSCGPVLQDRIRSVINSAASYSGDDAQKTAAYIQDRLIKVNNWPWNGIVVAPATPSGSYFCAQAWWGILIDSYDFGWNYYVFSGGQ